MFKFLRILCVFLILFLSGAIIWALLSFPNPTLLISLFSCMFVLIIFSNSILLRALLACSFFLIVFIVFALLSFKVAFSIIKNSHEEEIK
jgi:hypothetical protein